MAQRTIHQMDPSTAAHHADLCFTFLLRALDLRQKRPASLPAPALHSVDQASLAVLLALTMKLSEAKFKPLFLRLLDWGSTPRASHPDAKPLGRQVALFTAVLGLTERLRSVFVPYFRYLLDSIAAQLGGALGDAGAVPRKKKKKKASSVAVAAGDEASAEPAVIEDTWRLRFTVHKPLRGVQAFSLQKKNTAVPPGRTYIEKKSTCPESYTLAVGDRSCAGWADVCWPKFLCIVPLLRDCKVLFAGGASTHEQGLH